MDTRERARDCVGLAVAAVWLALAAAPADASVNYGPISHKGLKKVGPASTGSSSACSSAWIANNSGHPEEGEVGEQPASSSYGKYLSLSNLASKYGATSSVRKAVVNAFKSQHVTATVDVTHLRASATLSIGKAQKMFGTKWADYRTSSGSIVALPVNTPKLPKGLKGNVDTIAGMRLTVKRAVGVRRARARGRSPGPRPAAPTRRHPDAHGHRGAVCLDTTDPACWRSPTACIPNQILTAYGIAPLHAAGLLGQGVRLAIVGEAPTPSSDVNQYRNCFGSQGTALKIHNGSGIQPILESSLDAMMVSMVAPQLDRFDLWVHPINEDADDGDVIGFLKMLAAPIQATSNGAPLPNVVSVSYGVCESTVSQYTASRTLVSRLLAAEAALGITVAVAAGDSGSSACARGVPPSQLTSCEKKPQVSWPASSGWVLAVGGTNLTLNPTTHRVHRPVERHGLPGAVHGGRRGWRRAEHVRVTGPPGSPPSRSRTRSTGWSPTSRLRRREPGLPDRLLERRPGLPQIRRRASHSSAARAPPTPLVAGMIALWAQQAKQQGAAATRLRASVPLLARQEQPGRVHRHHAGRQRLFGGSCCPRAAGLRPGERDRLADRQRDRRAARESRLSGG